MQAAARPHSDEDVQNACMWAIFTSIPCHSFASRGWYSGGGDVGAGPSVRNRDVLAATLRMATGAVVDARASARKALCAASLELAADRE